MGNETWLRHVELTQDAADHVELVLYDGRVYQKTGPDTVVEIKDADLCGAAFVLAAARGAVDKLQAKPARHLVPVPSNNEPKGERK